MNPLPLPYYFLKGEGNISEKRESIVFRLFVIFPLNIVTYIIYEWGSRGLNLIKMIGNKLKEATGEPRSTFFLFQQISMAIQKGNVECILGTIPTSIGLDEIFDFIYHESDT